MASIYDPESLESESKRALLMMELAMTLEAVTRLLVSKGIIAQVEIQQMKKELLNSPEYSKMYEMCQLLFDAEQLYKENPRSYLQKLFAAKAKGAI